MTWPTSNLSGPQTTTNFIHCQTSASILRRSAIRPRYSVMAELGQQALSARVGMGALCRDEHGLGAKDDAIVEDFQMVGPKRRTRGGDVDDDFSGARCGRSFGGAGTLDNTVAGHTFLGEKPAGQPQVFGGDAQAATMLGVEPGGDLVKIRHARHIEPALRDSNGNISRTEPDRKSVV